MTRKYESVVVTVEESKDLETISIEELMGILQSQELRLKQYDKNAIDQTFQVQSGTQVRNKGGNMFNNS